MSIAYALSKAGLNVVGVPKTIDNDLKSTDQTFGYTLASVSLLNSTQL